MGKTGPIIALSEINDENDVKKESYVTNIKIEQLVPFRNHPFNLRKGKEFEEFVQDIRSNGVRETIVVRRLGEEKYEILSGHNRAAAANEVGLKTITARVYKDLSDDEAALIVTRSNIHMRSKWSRLERVRAVSLHHESIKRQGQRTDKLHKNETEEAENNSPETSVENQQKLNARDSTAKEFGITPNAVVQYLRIDKLIDSLKKRFDDTEFNTHAADILSSLTCEQQNIVDKVLRSAEYSINPNKAKTLRKASDDGSFNQTIVKKILSETDKPKPIVVPDLKIKSTSLAKYFSPNQKPQEIEDEILKALEYYRQNAKDTDEKSVPTTETP